MFVLKTKVLIHVDDDRQLEHTDQCGKVGQHNYKCSVEIQSDNRLDNRGFVADHYNIRKMVETVFGESNDIDSCEQIAMKTSDAVIGHLNFNDVTWFRVTVKVKALGKMYGSVKHVRIRSSHDTESSTINV